MQNSFVQFVIRQFSGRFAAVVNSAILFVVLQAFAWLGAKFPPLAAICDPQSVATWLSLALITGLNALTNHQHLLDKATMTKLIVSLQNTPPVIPVERATFVHGPN
jgi:hypothetical protein